jgi:hypothetical protein
MIFNSENLFLIPFLLTANRQKLIGMANVAQPGMDLAQFRAALGRIGFPVDVQDALNAHGINGMYNLMIYSKDQIKRVCTVIRERPVNPLHISIEQEQFLTAMRHWVKSRVRTNRSIDPNLFTRDTAIAESIKMVNIAEEVTTEKESDVKMPERFKMTSKWIVFSEAVDTYLNRLKGQGRIPLNYIIRSVQVPVPGAVYQTEQELMIATAPLQGDQFDIDNERVYGIIKQLILEGPAWAYVTSDVDRAKNGRAAWLALRAHYEGESFLNKQKEDAYKSIESVHYKGERSTFTFEHFTGILTKAYNDLQRYGEPVLEAKKVRDLLNKIGDPKLESAKQAIRINIIYKNDFAMAVNFLAESVETFDKSKSRMIGETTQSRGNSRTSSYRGRGRGPNNQYSTDTRQHGGQGRGGRARGNRGRGRHNRNAGRGTYIPHSEWQAMTPEQRQAFLQARAASRIHAITSSLTVPDDVSTITNGTLAPQQQQIAQVSQVATPSVQGTNASIAAISTVTPQMSAFGGRAAHRG